MDHIWLIPVIAVIVWIVAAAARGQYAKESTLQPNQGPQGRPPRRRPTNTDIDRFLDDVKRRQQEQQRRRQAVEALEVEPVVIEFSPRPLPPPVRRPPKRQSVVLAEAIPVALPADVAPRHRTESLNIDVPEVTRTPLLEHLLELQRLLRSPQGVRTAFVLGEVLGPPRCKRHR